MHATHPLQTATLANRHGLRMTVTNLGAKIMSLWVPDRNGVVADVVLGYDTPERYRQGNPYFGATIGRYANRIAHASFRLRGNTYLLTANQGVHTLHGGPTGFHQRIWKMEAAGSHVDFFYQSRAGEEGYPGTLDVAVSYRLTDSNALEIDYRATTDAPTVINLTHHSFFNLAGEGAGSIEDHLLMLQADRFCPVDGSLIPTGELLSVEATPLDFRQPTAIGQRIEADDSQLRHARGYDHNWVLTKREGEFALAAEIWEPTSGRQMAVWTTEPGLQFYSGNFLDGMDVGKGGKCYGFRSAFCLEAQHFPDSPNHLNFPSTELLPGQVYEQKTAYVFRH